MKTRLTILTAVLILATMFGVNAQTKESKYGVDSAKTIMSASLYGEMVKQKNQEMIDIILSNLFIKILK